MARIATDGAFDVIVVGGGINGIGTFRDLSLQGLRVLLVEMNDFCSGCSAAPSRMIHGGLRYLENGEFDLVRESLQERDALLKNAPHMVKPLATTVPIRSVFSGLFNGAANFFNLPSKPAERGALTIKLGLMLYDWVTRKNRLLPKHYLKSSKSTIGRWPGLRSDVNYMATYYDAWISYPERLGLELIEDVAAEGSNSVAMNYCCLASETDGSLTITNQETGDILPVSAKAIVNATGAWVDQTAATLPREKCDSEAMVEGTKGSHLILDNQELLTALNDHMIYYENADGRVCILFPYFGKVLVGSTDIRVSKPGRTRCEEDEKSYILQSLKYVFPDIDVRTEQVVFSYSGIRPLPKSNHEFTGRISRGHFVKRMDGAVPQFCMIGGKWTTFRAFAEQTTDQVLSELGRKRVGSTLELKIGGGQNFPTDIAAWISTACETFDITEKRAEHVLAVYGSEATSVLATCQNIKDDEALVLGCSYTIGEIGHLIEKERVVHLSDILLRRTSLAISGVVSSQIIARIADIAAKLLGWDAQIKQHEVDELTKELESYHGVSPKLLSFRDKKGI